MPNRYHRDLTKNSKPDASGGQKGKGKMVEATGMLCPDKVTFADHNGKDQPQSWKQGK